MVDTTIRFEEHDIKKIAQKEFGLLSIKFKDDKGNTYVWWPKWDDIRFMFLLSVFTEWANEGPYKWSEMQQFLNDMESLPETVAAWLESTLPAEREKLKKLIDEGKLREAATKLTRTDLLKAVDWLAQRRGVSPLSGPALRK